MGLDVLGLIGQASLVVQLVMGLLALLSISSWTIIVFKWFELRRAQRSGGEFVDVYTRETFRGTYKAAQRLDRSPLAVLFLSAASDIADLSPTGRVTLPLDRASQRKVSKSLDWTATDELQRIERGLSFLATTGSSAPFIGLFGTVVGIINAFEEIGRAGSASLAVVAPGIAEALIATAIGLFAAIPATIAYNYLSVRVGNVASALDLFREQLVDDLGDDTQASAGGRA